MYDMLIFRCFHTIVIVKTSSGPRYVVGCRAKVDRLKLKAGTRVALDMTTLTIMKILPREVDQAVFNMMREDPGNVSFSAVGGLSEQIRELREVRPAVAAVLMHCIIGC